MPTCSSYLLLTQGAHNNIPHCRFLCSHCNTAFANSSNRRKHERKCDVRPTPTAPGAINPGLPQVAVSSDRVLESLPAFASSDEARAQPGRAGGAGAGEGSASVRPAVHVSDSVYFVSPARPPVMCRTVGSQTGPGSVHKTTL